MSRNNQGSRKSKPTNSISTQVGAGGLNFMSLKVKSLFTKSARNDEEKIAKWKNVAAFPSSDDQKQSRFWNSIIHSVIMQN